jgi:hypothetical protein
MRPFDGVFAGNGTAHESQLIAAIAASSAPGRLKYLTSAGFFNTANSFDQVHPYGVEDITHIAPQVAAAVKTILAGTPTLTSRTATFQLATGRNTDNSLIYAANVTGAKISIYDESSPDLHTVARYKTASGTFDSTGTCSITYQSTLAAGSTCTVVVWVGTTRYTNSVVVS